MQNESSIDLAQYYCLSANATYNGMLYQRTNRFTPVIHVFRAFADIFELGQQIQICRDKDDPYAVGTTNGLVSKVLISNYNNVGKNLKIEGFTQKKFKIFKLSGDDGFVLINENAVDLCEFYCDTNDIYFLEIY